MRPVSAEPIKTRYIYIIYIYRERERERERRYEYKDTIHTHTRTYTHTFIHTHIYLAPYARVQERPYSIQPVSVCRERRRAAECPRQDRVEPRSPCSPCISVKRDLIQGKRDLLYSKRDVLNLNYLAHRFMELSVENFDCHPSVSKGDLIHR